MSLIINIILSLVNNMNYTPPIYECKKEDDYFKYLEITGFSACSFILGLILAKLCIR